MTFGSGEVADKFVSLFQASDGEKSDQDLVVDDASEVIIKNLQGFPLILYLEIVWELLH
jgi:hypothetical protein